MDAAVRELRERRARRLAHASPTRLAAASAAEGNAAAAGGPDKSASAVTRSLFAGGLAGALSRTAVAPLERLKILYQVQHTKPPSVWSALVTIGQKEGLKGYFRGNGANCIRIFPNSALKFYAFEEAKDLIHAYQRYSGAEEKMTPALRLVAGAAAGIVAMSSTYPLDMVRGRLSVQTETGGSLYRGMGHAFVSVAREEGVRALFKGWLPSVIGVIPYAGMNFGVYETLKHEACLHYGLQTENELSTGMKLAAGTFAGCVGQTFAYPFDVARRRMQVEGWKGNTAEQTILTEAAAKSGRGGGAAAAGAAPKRQVAYMSMMDAFKRTVKEEGVAALWKGIVPNFLKVGPSIGIAFVVYEHSRDIMGVPKAAPKISA